MNHFQSFSNLPSIQNLFRIKEDAAQRAIASTFLWQIKEDQDLLLTLNQVKRQAVLIPVQFGEMHIREGSHFYNLQKNYFVTVDLPFTGSSELFSYVPEGEILSSGLGMLQPIGNILNIEVEVSQLDKKEVLQQAQQLLQSTFAAIELSNKQVISWSTNRETEMEEALQRKRKELTEFYN